MPLLNTPKKPNIKIPEGYDIMWNEAKSKWVMYFKGYSKKVSSSIGGNAVSSPINKNEKVIGEKGNNKTMLNAKRKAYDNFYTSLNDIAQAVHPHAEEFKGYTVYCPCDKMYIGINNFLKFFSLYFKELGINKVICTQYIPEGRGIKWEVNKENVGDGLLDESKIPSVFLHGNGSFDSEECRRIMLGENGDGSDVIVCANPPFSRWKEFIDQIIDCGSHFLVLSNQNSITYKEAFRYIMDNKMWFSYPPLGNEMLFHITDEHKKRIVEEQKEGAGWRNVNGEIMARLANTRWVTNFTVNKRMEELYLSMKYKGNEDKYPNVINLQNCIDIGHHKKNGDWEGKVSMIPKDYPYVMAVPITFLEVYNPNQFEIVGSPDAQVYPEGWGNIPQWFIDEYNEHNGRKAPIGRHSTCIIVDGKPTLTFKRLLIKHRINK